MFANSKRSVDPLPTIELDEQRRTSRHENETEKQRGNREARPDLHATIQLDIEIALISRRCRGFLDRGWVDFRDIMPRVFLRGDGRMILLVTFDFYRKNAGA